MQTDEQLIADYLRGNEHALRLLIERYLKPIYNFVYRYTGEFGSAEEIAQDVFAKRVAKVRIVYCIIKCICP